MALWIALNALYSEFQTESERRAIREFVFSDEHRLSDQQMRGILDNPGAHYFETRIIRDVRGTGLTRLRMPPFSVTPGDLQSRDSRHC